MAPTSPSQRELFGNTVPGSARREAEQAEAIHAPRDRHLRIVAGPGAGKTHVLVERVAHLVGAGTPPDRIALITYTNSARDELLTRLTARLGDGPEFAGPGRAFVGTIHQFCLRLLAGEPDACDRARGVRILDPDSAERLFAIGGPADGPGYQDLALAWDRWDGLGDPPADPTGGHWAVTLDELREQGLATFTSLQLWALEAIAREDESPSGATLEFEQVLVDEFQDTSGLQVRVLEALAVRGARVTVVGDPEQSVFRFAGADPGQLPAFPGRFKPCTSLTLGANGRSSGLVVEVANRLRVAGEQFALRTHGRQPRLFLVGSEAQQAEAVAGECRRLLESEGALTPGHIAVLSREGEANAVVTALEHCDVPVWSSREERFEAKPHIRDLLACLEAMAWGDDLHFQMLFFDRVVRGGPRTWAAVTEALDRVGDLQASVDEALGAVARPRQASLRQYLQCRDAFSRIAELPDPGQQARAVFEQILEPRLDLRQRQHRSEIDLDLERAFGLGAKMSDVPALIGHLRQGGLSPDGQGDRVVVGSFHFGKGREWPVVFLLDLTRGVVPHRFNDDPEEERRLMHVGLSRARDRLYLFSPERLPGRGEGASPFLERIFDLCRVTDLRGLQGGAG